MFDHVWIYFNKTGWGYELKGMDIISGLDAFLHVDDTYIVEFSYTDIADDMSFSVYQWDNSQKTRRTISEKLKRENVLVGVLKNVPNLPEYVSEKIKNIYLEHEVENANS
jgi:hypothetical protein